jgi:hypothetical protein
LDDLLKLSEKTFNLRNLSFHLRKLGLRGIADPYRLREQPFQLFLLSPEGVNDIDYRLCHLRPLVLPALLVGTCVAARFPMSYLIGREAAPAVRDR